MSLLYDGIELGLLHTRRYTAEAQMSDDGLDYLCTKYTLDVDFVWHERATASNMNNGQGDRLGVSIDILQQRLSQPRGRLVYRIGNDVVLSSPVRNPALLNGLFPCDVKGGPFPKVMSLTVVNGGKSAFGSFRVETYLNECNDADGYALSHRWSDSQSMPGPQWYLHRKVKGHVVFRLDKLIADNFSPDSFRQWFLHPIPFHFRRENIVVWVSEDGSRLEYEFEDVQQSRNIVKESGIANVGGFTLGGFAFWKTGNPLPTTHVKVEIWGFPKTSNVTMADAAILLAGNKMKATRDNLRPDQSPNVGPLSTSLQIDHKERYACLETDVLQLSTVVLNRDAPTNYRAWMNLDGPVPGLLDRRVNGDVEYTNPVPLRADGGPTRTTQGFQGSTIGVLAAQALSTPCQVPNVGWFNDNNGGRLDVDASGIAY
jgi:hypothetical protein